MRFVPRSRVAVAVLAVPTLLLGLAACGTADTSTRSVSAQAAQTSSQNGRWNETTLVPAMKAAIDKQQSVHVSVRATGKAARSMTAQGDVALRKARPDLAFSTARTPFGGPAEVRVVNGVAYVSMPPMTPEGKFFEIRPGGRSAGYGGMMGSMRGSPEDGFAAMKAGLRKVTYVGGDTVGGKRVGHYRVTVDPRAASRAAGMPHLGGMPRGYDMPHAYGRSHLGRVPRTVTFDLWLDDKALVHRVAMRKAQRGSLVVDLTDWNKPVSIQAPPRNDIVEQGSGQWPGMMGGRSRS